MRYLRRVFPLIIIGALCAGGLYYLWQADNKAAPESLRMGAAAQQITGLIAIAKGMGYDESHGLSMSMAKYKSGQLALADLERGMVDVAAVAETPIAIDAFKRSDLRVIATIGSTDKEEKIVARRDRGIRTPADLRGKTVATQKPGTSPHFFLHIFLTANGLSDGDVEISFNESKEVVGKLLNGSVDAIAMSEPYGTESTTKLAENAIVFANDGLYNRTFNIVTTEEFAAAHPQAITKLLRALIDAERLVRTDPSLAQKHVAHVYDIPLQNVASTWSDFVLAVSLDQSLLITLDDQARWARDMGLASGTSIPNFLPMMYTKGLDAVRPLSVTVIR